MSNNQKHKQKTLFQAWNKKDASISGQSTNYTKNQCKTIAPGKLYSAAQAAHMMSADAIDLTDDDLIEAAEMLESTMDDSPGTSRQTCKNAEVENIPGFDNSLGHIWIFPTNYPIRNYQFSIVKSALMKNTLVSLPTGLGKTFIAAVVMYNFYRWYPQGKIVFMAPTKPLVSQQIDACYKIMGIPLEDQAEITGMTTSVHKREALWTSKRVFFLTPQVINNDLARGVCPASQIKCVVIDEAHKAQGKHAYCQVVNQLASCSRKFRVLALSATPGTDVKSVQQVITNLLISHIEIRTEDSIDIQGFSHQRKVEKVVCKLDETMTKMRENYLKVIGIFTKSLVSRRALFERETSSYSKYGLLMARDQFRKDPPSGLNKYEMGSVEGDFATCISLFHGLELLQQHGMRSFFIFLKAMMEGDKGNMRAKSVLGANSLFREMYQDLTNMFGDSPNPTVLLTQAGQTQQSFQKAHCNGQPYVYSHPKIKKLEEVVLSHFQDFIQNHEGDTTRVMVFCQYRDSVQEITELLQKHRPLVRPMQFVGHSTASGKIAKFTQKDQLKVVSKFREGGYNTLISTCVGEEGLDIGDVDLIVCFDAHKSPIRLVQRMGRTGRKRKGRIVMLVTEGKEERDYNSSLSNRKSIQRAITSNTGRNLQFYQHNPRMIPHGLNPEPFKMHMTIKLKPEPSAGNSKAAKKKNPRKTENLDISVMMKNVESKDSVFLTHDQVREWDEKLKLNAKEKAQLKLLPACGLMASLEKGKSRDVASPSRNHPMLSLSEWSVWQTRFQSSDISGHSAVTNNFVEIMEICDLIKQSEETSFDENLAPFLGVKYDKSRMEAAKKNKMDSFLVPKEKPLKKATKKERKSVEKIKKIVENDKKLSPEMSTDTDFEPDPLKKIFPSKTNFRNKLLAFSSDHLDSASSSTDDTLTGIESILHDPSDTIDESSNDSSVKHCSSIDEKISNSGVSSNTLGDIDDVEMPDFDIGGWGSDENSGDGRELMESKENYSNENMMKEVNDEKDVGIVDNNFGSKNCQLKLTENDTSKEVCISELPESTDSNPLSDLVDSLSAVPTQTPFDHLKQNKPRRVSTEKPPTPPSFSSINFDFLDEFDNSAFDDENNLKTKGKSKPIKRSCFSLGDDDSNNNTKENVSFNYDDMDIKSVSGACKNDKKGSVIKEDIIDDIKSDGEQLKRSMTNDSPIYISPKRVAVPDKDIQNVKMNDIMVAKSEKLVENVSRNVATFDTSADMFDVDFDLGDFDDSETSSKLNATTSPVQMTKKRTSPSSSGNSSHLKNSHGSPKILCDEIMETSLAHVTLTQRVENRALFADLPKSQTIGNIPVAEVKPQQSFSTSISDSAETLQDPVQTSSMENISTFEKIDNENGGFADSQFTESLKRKRHSVESTEVSYSKRRKETQDDSTFASPARCDNFKDVKVETPRTSRSSEDSEESPLCVRKKRNNKLLFSPESELSQRPVVTDSSVQHDIVSFKNYPTVKKQRYNILNDIHKNESPVPAVSLNVRKTLLNKHSTPKCPKFSNEEQFSDDDIDFVGKIGDQIDQHGGTTNRQYGLSNKIKRRNRMRNFVEDEAEVSDDGVHVSSDENEENTEDFEEMQNFMNDNTVLTQHVADGSAIDEQAMYLQAKPDFFAEPSKFEGHNGKFKLAYGVGEGIDVFSQEVPEDVSGYEEDSFVCDEIEHDIDDDNVFGEVTLLENISSTSMPKQRVTRRQAELNKLRKTNYDHKPVSPVVSKLKKQFGNIQKQSRKRIICMDDSTDSFESSNTSLVYGQKLLAAQNSESSTEAWSCPACTLENQSSSQFCELCDSERPSSTGSNEFHSEVWACNICTYENRGPRTICDMCDAKYVNSYPEKKISGEKNPSINKEKSVCTSLSNRNTSLNKHSSTAIVQTSIKVQSKNPSITKSTASSHLSTTVQNHTAYKCNMNKNIESSNVVTELTVEDDSCDIISATPVPLRRKSESRKRSQISSLMVSNTGVKNTTTTEPAESAQSSQLSVTSSLMSSANNNEREERLRRCKEKQREFRARMEKRRSVHSNAEQRADAPSTSNSESFDSSNITPTRKATFLSKTKTSLKFDSPQSSRSTSDLINSSLVSPITREPVNVNADKLVVLVDSKELSSSQPIITTLRCKHKVHVVVASLPHCDYIVGRGTAVERKVVSDFSQISNRQKLIARFQQLNQNYDRVYLIIEQDRVKKGDLSNKRAQHSSYYTSTICALSVTSVRILYSDNQDETADILHMLSAREKSLKRSIDFGAAEKANDAKFKSVLRLYSSIPKVSFVSALYMCLNFNNFKEVASSSVEKLIQKAHLSTRSAAEVYNFCRRNFDLQMTPSL